MTAIHNSVPPTLASDSGGRRLHRQTCVLAGGLALVGGILAIALDPWFAVLAAAAGLWLVLAPDTTACRVAPIAR